MNIVLCWYWFWYCRKQCTQISLHHHPKAPPHMFRRRHIPISLALLTWLDKHHLHHNNHTIHLRGMPHLLKGMPHTRAHPLHRDTHLHLRVMHRHHRDINPHPRDIILTLELLLHTQPNQVKPHPLLGSILHLLVKPHPLLDKPRLLLTIPTTSRKLLMRVNQTWGNRACKKIALWICKNIMHFKLLGSSNIRTLFWKSDEIAISHYSKLSIVEIFPM